MEKRREQPRYGMVYVFAVIADDMESYYDLKEGDGTELFAPWLQSELTSETERHCRLP